MANNLKHTLARQNSATEQIGDLPDELRRIRGVARPARFPNHDLEPERELVG